MGKIVRTLAYAIAIAVLGSGTVLAAAGSPPAGPIEAPKTGAELKHACGQNVDGFSDRVGERFLREMLIVQCWAVVSTAVEMVNSGEYTLGDEPVWQCLEDRSDTKALAITFVTWVGRRPPLLRKPASIAFIEAIELSARCKS